MFRPSEFRDLVSGRRRGLAAALRLVFRLAEVPYTAAVRWRNYRFDCGKAAIHRVPVPVVSVGNLTLGGTGKTPLVEWLVRWFNQRGVRVVVISRGYKGGSTGENDESLELARSFPQVPHLRNPDRVVAARSAVEQGAQVIILDDAFQHRRLARDLDIVLLDALEPFGFGHVFPRGTLREPIAGLRRAQVVVLTRADILSPPQREAIWTEVGRHAPEAVRAEGAHAPRALCAADGRHQSLDALKNQRVAAFCGIGNPAGFRHTLGLCGFQVAAFREFPDHHRYTSADLESLAAWAEQLHVDAVLCTRKDLVKLPVDRLGSCPLWAVLIEMNLLRGREAFEQRLVALSESRNG